MLRPAEDADVDAMLAWRNHPRVREMSLTQHEITPDEHAAWWARTRNDPTRAVLVYERGGVPSAFDRVLATRLGMAAIDSVVEGYWGTMVALKGTDIEHVGFQEALGKLKTVPQNRYDEAAVLFG